MGATRNYYYAVENCGFEPEPDGRSEAHIQNTLV